MKIRDGFVSNSSSSSYLINKKTLLPCQIAMIHDHSEFARLYEHMAPRDCLGDSRVSYHEERWHVEETDDAILVGTMMDNFDMYWFLVNVALIDEKDIKYNGDYWP